MHEGNFGAGDENRTHGTSLGSLGITIIRRPLLGSDGGILSAEGGGFNRGPERRRGAAKKPQQSGGPADSVTGPEEAVAALVEE